MFVHVIRRWLFFPNNDISCYLIVKKQKNLKFSDCLKTNSLTSCIRFYVFTPVIVQIVVFWVVSPCILAGGFHSASGTWNLL